MRIRIIAIALLLLSATAPVMVAQNAEALFQNGRVKAADGKFQEAIQIFERIRNEHSSDHRVVARALIELGESWEGLDLAKARGFYNLVISQHPDQPDLVENARKRVKALADLDTITRVTIPTPYTDDPFSFAISPDARSLVFQSTTPDGTGQLWLQKIDVAKSIPAPIPGTEGAKFHSFPFWSPDSRFIAFFAAGKLKRIDVRGGTAQVLTDANAPFGGSWNGAGVILFTADSTLIYRVPAEGGARVRVVGREREEFYNTRPSFLPDGQRFVFYRWSPTANSVNLGSLSPGVGTKVVTVPPVQAAIPAGDYMFTVTNGALIAQRMDWLSQALTGNPIPLGNRVGLSNQGVALSASASGPLAYRESVAVNRQLVWLDRTGRQTGTLGDPDPRSPCCARIATDGRTVTFHRANGANGTVWMIDTAGGAARQLKDHTGPSIWSPDRTHLVLSPMVNGQNVLFDQPLSFLEGAGSVLRKESASLHPNDWSANGFLAYTRVFYPTDAADLFILPLSGGNPIPVAQTAAHERNGRFAPNGYWIAYESDESGKYEVYVQPFPGLTNQRRKVSMNGGTQGQWGRNGQELYFLSRDNHLMVVPVSFAGDNQNIALSEPRPLFEKPLVPGSQFEASADGERFLVNAPVQDAPPIIVISNWARPTR